MTKNGTNHTKDICQLYYQDKIWELSEKGKSVRQITDFINKRCIPNSRFSGLTLSRGTIYKIIKRKKDDNR
jgi:hypothetical protein